MSKTESKSSFHCRFCRKSLKPLPIELADLPLLPLLVRPYQCPHCFSVYRRPFRLIAMVPGVKTFANRFEGGEKRKKNMMASSDIGGPFDRFMSAFGRIVQAIEDVIASIFFVIFEGIWAGIMWLPRLLTGKKRRRKKSRRRGRGKFLNSD